MLVYHLVCTTYIICIKKTVHAAMFIHHMHVMDSAYRSHVIHRAYTEAAACQTTRGQITRFVAAPWLNGGFHANFPENKLLRKFGASVTGLVSFSQSVCLSAHSVWTRYRLQPHTPPKHWCDHWYSTVQRQTAVTAYFLSKQLPLFAFAMQISRHLKPGSSQYATCGAAWS